MTIEEVLANWCEANPMCGRGMVQRGELEWFVVR